MKKINRQATVANLVAKQQKIIFKGPEDEAAADYFGELESCIIAIKSGYEDEAIEGAMESLGLREEVVYGK